MITALSSTPHFRMAWTACVVCGAVNVAAIDRTCFVSLLTDTGGGVAPRSERACQVMAICGVVKDAATALARTASAWTRSRSGSSLWTAASDHRMSAKSFDIIKYASDLAHAKSSASRAVTVCCVQSLATHARRCGRGHGPDLGLLHHALPPSSAPPLVHSARPARARAVRPACSHHGMQPSRYAAITVHREPPGVAAPPCPLKVS